MPWTFSHPAAILPFKRLCPAWLSLPALAIGAMVPDAGYHFGLYGLSNIMHTPRGTVTAGIPTGLLLLLAFFAVRRPVWFLLPEPHRSALASLVARPWSLRPTQLASYVVSILLGAWTHIIWDSFTHWAWAVRRIPLLQKRWITVAHVDFAGYSVMQHLSTVVGFAALVIAYVVFLKRQPRVPHDPGADKTRYLIIFGSASIALVAALTLAYLKARPLIDTDAMSNFVFNTAIYGASLFAVLGSIGAFIHARKRI